MNECRQAQQARGRRMATKGRPGRSFGGDPLVSPANAFAGRELGRAGGNAGRMSSSRGPPFSVEQHQNNATGEGGQAGAFGRDAGGELLPSAARGEYDRYHGRGGTGAVASRSAASTCGVNEYAGGYLEGIRVMSLTLCCASRRIAKTMISFHKPTLDAYGLHCVTATFRGGAAAILRSTHVSCLQAE
jgi:hypothetical protein